MEINLNIYIYFKQQKVTRRLDLFMFGFNHKTMIPKMYKKWILVVLFFPQADLRYIQITLDLY